MRRCTRGDGASYPSVDVVVGGVHSHAFGRARSSPLVCRKSGTTCRRQILWPPKYATVFRSHRREASKFLLFFSFLLLVEEGGVPGEKGRSSLLRDLLLRRRTRLGDFLHGASSRPRMGLDSNVLASVPPSLRSGVTMPRVVVCGSRERAGEFFSAAAFLPSLFSRWVSLLAEVFVVC